MTKKRRSVENHQEKKKLQTERGSKILPEGELKTISWASKRKEEGKIKTGGAWGKGNVLGKKRGVCKAYS